MKKMIFLTLFFFGCLLVNGQNYSRNANIFNIEMVYVAGGTYAMGCTGEQGDCDENERPAHRVTISSFYIGKCEVTQAQWRAVMGSNPSSFQGDNLPVEQVSWDDAQEFIRRLNAQTGRQYRLPTEAEWEFAARGGNNSKGYRFSGSNAFSTVAWYENNSDYRTHPVGTKLPNELGIYDMSGNVHEWCSDYYDEYEYSNSYTQTDPKGPMADYYHVFRGGGWDVGSRHARVSHRSCFPYDYSSDFIGFRLASGSR